MVRFSRHLKVLAAITVLGVTAGCETLESINPFGGSKELTDAEKFDDRPITRETGDIPADTSNANHTDEDLKPTP